VTAAAARPSDVRAFFGALAFPLAAAVMFGVSVVAFGPRGPAVALLVNLFVLFEVAGFSQVFRLPMTAVYFRPARFERAWIYESLGIRVFKRVMRSAIYRRLNPDFRLQGGRRGLDELNQTMCAAEAAHAVAFAAVAAVTAGTVGVRWFDAAAWLTFFNVVLNGYPMMLQRYNRLLLRRVRRG
jgi:Glycosyl-4,4'-diaponeurosporenoate acyltransferase